MNLNEDERIRLAVVENELKGIREQHKAHAAEINKRFDAYEKKHSEMLVKLQEVITLMNKGKGAWLVGISVAGFIGALVIAGITTIIKKLSF